MNLVSIICHKPHDMKRFLTLCVMLLTAVSTWADNISATEAESLAKAFLSSQKVSPKRARALSSARFILAAQLTDCYVFNLTDSAGYVIVASDDVAPQPILGYSDTGKIDVTHMPCNLSWMLEEYSRELAVARSQQAAATRAKNIAKAPVLTKANITPLVESHWNQDAPYNALCPTVSGTATYTGCVATATAQIMRYHRHPAKGKGSHSYTWGSTTLSRTFSNSTYDWDNMLLDYGSSYTTEEQNAVARLMVDVGYAVDMDYGTTASGATSSSVASALPTYFGYSNTIKSVYRSSYGLTDWTNLLYDELAADRPVYVSGSNTQGGHAFVLDGYRDGYFHINWGWGGTSDGYFLISALDPETQGIGGSSAGYNSDQAAIIGIEPAADGETPAAAVPDILMESFTAPSATVSRSNAFSFYNQSSYIYNVGSTDATILVGLKVVDEAGTVTYLPSYQELTIASGYGTKSSAANVPLANFPTDATQTYKVYPAFKNSADGTWHDITLNSTSTNRYLTATTDASNVYFSVPSTPVVKLSASTPVLPEKIFLAKAFTVTTTITATGGEYNGKIYAYTNNRSIGSATVNVDEKTSATISISCTAPSTDGNKTLTLKDKDGNVLTDNVSYVVETVPSGTFAISATDMSLVSTTPSDLHAKVTLNCTAGYFSGQVIAFIYPQTGGSSLGSLKTNLTTWAGNTSTVDFEGTFAGTVGTRYLMAFYYLNGNSWKQINYTFFTLTADGTSQTSAFENIGSLIDGVYAHYKAGGEKVSTSNRPTQENVKVDFDADTNPATVVAVLSHDESSDVKAGNIFLVDQSQRGLMLIPSDNSSNVFDLTSLKVGDKITGQLAGNYSEKKGIPTFEVCAKAGSYTSSITTDTSGEATDTEEATYPVLQIPNIHFLAKTNLQDKNGDENVGDVTLQAYGNYLNSVVTLTGTVREENGEFYLLQNEDDAVSDAALTRICFTADEFPGINLSDYVGTTGTFEGLLIKRDVAEAKLSALKANFFLISKLYMSEGDHEMRITDLASNGSLAADVDIWLHRTKLVTADAGYTTICLPFNMTAAEFTEAFGCDIALLAEATQNVSADGVQQFRSIDSKTIEAGVPYLLKATGTQTKGDAKATTDDDYWAHIGTKTISTALPSQVTANYLGDFFFCGTYGKKQYTTGDDGRPTTTLIADGGSGKYQYISSLDGTLRYLPASSKLAFNGLRAYYHIPSYGIDQVTGKTNQVSIAIDGGEVTTINILDTTAADDAPIYTISGQLVGHNRSTLPKGVYIQQGQKFVVK